MRPTCATCAYFDDDGDCGTCCRHAPRMVGEMHDPDASAERGHWQNAVWPWIDMPSAHWCGEYKPHDDTPNKEN